MDLETYFTNEPFADDPLANAVYEWVAYGGVIDWSAMPAIGPLVEAFPRLLEPAPPLYRGHSTAGPDLPIRDTFEIRDPWLSFTTRRDYALLHTDGILISMVGAQGVCLRNLREAHPGFVQPERMDEWRRLHYESGNLWDRVAAEDEWLVAPGQYYVIQEHSDSVLRTVCLSAQP